MNSPERLAVLNSNTSLSAQGPPPGMQVVRRVTRRIVRRADAPGLDSSLLDASRAGANSANRTANSGQPVQVKRVVRRVRVPLGPDGFPLDATSLPIDPEHGSTWGPERIWEQTGASRAGRFLPEGIDDARDAAVRVSARATDPDLVAIVGVDRWIDFGAPGADA